MNREEQEIQKTLIAHLKIRGAKGLVYWHTPNGGMLTIGMWSMMLPATWLLVITGFGVGVKLLGAAPNVHCIRPPMQVCIGMAVSCS